MTFVYSADISEIYICMKLFSFAHSGNLFHFIKSAE